MVIDDFHLIFDIRWRTNVTQLTKAHYIQYEKKYMYDKIAAI